MVNLLSKQKSLYLQQHETNPVNWLPWSEKAFEKAKKEDKPIFLSVGYSSCHWCHVIAHESYSDKDVAKIMNEKFISIKLDKEEYPDIDSFYMEFMISNFGHGGWPLNVFINHNKAPFYSITYLPKNNFINLLNYIYEEYQKNNTLKEQKIIEKPNLNKLDDKTTKEILNSIQFKIIDHDNARFPQALFLLYGLSKGYEEEVKTELVNMITKGLFDHIEGGFFRYTVDPEYKIPHFEKMLYDQATILLLLAEFYKKDKDELIEYAIRKTTSWLNEKMLLSSGLYGSATDADTKQGEGYYYTIEKTDNEVIKLFNLNEAGVHESRFVPWLDFEYYKNNKEKSERIINKYKEIRTKLDKPGLDKKSVMSINCFLGYSLLKCAETLNDDNIRDIAINLFKQTKLYHIDKKRYYHIVYGKTKFKNQEYLEDYSAYLLFLSEIIKIKPELKTEIDTVIGLIKDKFIINNKLITTTYELFDNYLLWQDSPFASSASMLLNALLNLKSKELDYFVSISSTVLNFLPYNPNFFGFWLLFFNQYYNRT